MHVSFWVIDSALNYLKTTILIFSSFFLKLAKKLDNAPTPSKSSPLVHGLKHYSLYSLVITVPDPFLQK